MQHSANQFRHSAKSLPWPCFRKRYWILSTENRWSINWKMSLLYNQEKSKWKVTFMAHAGLVVKFYAIVVRKFHVRGGLLSGNQMSMSIKIWGWWRLLNNCFKSGRYELFPLMPSKNSQIVLHSLRVDDDDTLLDFRVHVMCLRGECLWVARGLNLCNMEGETYQFGFAIVLQIHLTICTSFNLVLTLENLNNRPTPLDQLMQILIVFLCCYNFYVAISLLPKHRK